MPDRHPARPGGASELELLEAPEGEWARLRTVQICFLADRGKRTATSTPVGAKSGFLIVTRALQRIREHGVSLVYQRKALCGGGVAGILVGMKLLDETAVRSLYHRGTRVRADFQDLIQQCVQPDLGLVGSGAV